MPETNLNPTCFYEDLAVGEKRVSAEREVGQAEIIAFAQEYDPQWFHTDAEAAQGSVFGGLIASGIQSIALWCQIDHSATNDIAWMCGIRWDNVHFLGPVRPGDRLHTVSECLSKRLSDSKPDRGVVGMRCSLVNQRGEEVLVFESLNLIRVRNPG